MQHWVAIVGEDRFASERLYAHDSVIVPAQGVAPTAGDPVLLVVAGDPPQLFGLGKILSCYGESVAVAYTHRVLDEPVPSPLPPEGLPSPSEALPFEGLPSPSETHRSAESASALGLAAIPAEAYERVAGQVPASRRIDADRSEWFVSVTLPIEARSRAEAVREFWTYIDKLGPQELPAYVWPRGDELAMQSFVLGTPTIDDPEDAE
jgi:hypothetical protein